MKAYLTNLDIEIENIDFIPRIGETWYMPHYGSFLVTDIIYNISDCSDKKDLMWVDIVTERK